MTILLMEINESEMKIPTATVAHFTNLICSPFFDRLFADEAQHVCVWTSGGEVVDPPPSTGGVNSPDFGKRKNLVKRIRLF